LSTSQPTVVTTLETNTNLSSSSSTSSVLHLPDLPTPTSVPAGLRGAFEAPHLIVPIDKSDPTKVVGNGYTALLSPNVSTVFVFDVAPEHQGKICNLVFFVPPAIPFEDLAPVKIRSPGGISVSRLNNQPASQDISASDVGSAAPVGSAPSIQFATQYNVGATPCEAGQRVAYQVDSTGGLAIDFFQMTSPPLGLFMIPG
jgi:glucan endo-1,3-beta-D-glucosidase